LELIQSLDQIAACLDEANGGRGFSEAVTAQIVKINDPALTPSAQILSDMKKDSMPYFHFVMEKALEQHQRFNQSPPNLDKIEEFKALTEQSFQEQLKIEESDTLSFDEYLASYFRQ